MPHEQPPNSADIAVVHGTHDAGTGLLNKHGFHMLGIQWISWATAEPNRTFQTLSLDLNGLKDVNDTFGEHRAGDLYIQLAIRALGNILHPPYLLGRYGGDEFSILCCAQANPRTDDLDRQRKMLLTQVQSTTISIRNGLENILQITGEWMMLARIGFSAGCDHWRPGMSLDDMLDSTDKAMYRQKQESKQGILNGAVAGLSEEQQSLLKEAILHQDMARRCLEAALPQLNVNRLLIGTL